MSGNLEELKRAFEGIGELSVSTPERITQLKSESYYKEEVEVSIDKMFEDVVLPEYKHDGDACADIRAYRIISLKNDMGKDMPIPENFESVTLHQGWRVRVGAGFKVNIPKGYAINISGRSGDTFDRGYVITNAPGKADGPYKGEFMVNIMKVSREPMVISKNDRIAQMEIVPQIRMLGVKMNGDSIRGEKGLGSSGVK